MSDSPDSDSGPVKPDPRSGKVVVLVIDDSDVDREVMMELLQSAGLEVHGLPSPIGATRAAREKGASVVVVDQNLPAMDGSKLTGIFRSNRGLQHIKVVMVSSSDTQHMLDVAREAKADAFVGKSQLGAQLVQTIVRLTTR